MYDPEIDDQTAFGVAGIPTPPEQQDVTATDMVSDAVAQIMDNLEHPFDDETEEE